MSWSLQVSVELHRLCTKARRHVVPLSPYVVEWSITPQKSNHQNGLFFHLLHRFLSDSYMVSLCPDLLEQHSTVLNKRQYIPTSAAHLLSEKKRDYISSVLKNRAPCYTAHSMLIIHKAFYNKGRFYFTDLHFQTPTHSFHSSDVNFFFPVHPMPRLKTQNCYKCF